jgi:hypothetical protein
MASIRGKCGDSHLGPSHRDSGNWIMKEELVAIRLNAEGGVDGTRQGRERPNGVALPEEVSEVPWEPGPDEFGKGLVRLLRDFSLSSE